MIEFHPTDYEEKSKISEGYRDSPYCCAHCNHNTQGRVLVSERHSVSQLDRYVDVLWCRCSCGKGSILLKNNVGDILHQWPSARKYKSGSKWPGDIQKLFSEAAASFSVQAFTSVTMACRKILMACACEKGASEGGSFLSYVDYIVEEVLVYPTAKNAIDKIRHIGNGANHSIEFVTEEDATTVMDTIIYMLDALYALPAE